jgi:hypothetical protein
MSAFRAPGKIGRKVIVGGLVSEQRRPPPMEPAKPAGAPPLLRRASSRIVRVQIRTMWLTDVVVRFPLLSALAAVLPVVLSAIVLMRCVSRSARAREAGRV